MMDSKSTQERVEMLVEEVNKTESNHITSEFGQAVEEITQSLLPLFQRDPKLLQVWKVMLEPERVIQFRVCWQDDEGDWRTNRGYRVQYNSAIGPYKGGLRFHPSVNLSILKFLGLEQILKNSLTTLPMGGGKGGSDFDPKGKSDNEVRRFCQAFMGELYRHIGQFVDVPAGDIGVGGREIGFLYGSYKRVTNSNTQGILTGKALEFGGSHIRPEATGYGLIYFANECLKANGMSMQGKRCVVSGSGNVAQYAAQKILQLGGKVLTLSDSSGFIVENDPAGITAEGLQFVMNLKNVKRGRISEYINFSKTAVYTGNGARPWGVVTDYAFPCATQNEIDKKDALQLVANGVTLVGEGSNMPCSNEAITVLKKGQVMFLPAKAANAGGVACSGLEMSQNSLRLSWTREEVDTRLQDIMKAIFKQCDDTAKELGEPGNYQLGANVAGFLKVADAMLANGDVVINLK